MCAIQVNQFKNKRYVEVVYNKIYVKLKREQHSIYLVILSFEKDKTGTIRYGFIGLFYIYGKHKLRSRHPIKKYNNF